MNQFGLIIEETTAGSNLQFISSHLDRTDLEIIETLTDERTLASQLANLSDVYSVQVTNNFKVYSLIVTNLTDFLGRSGYYAIRLYAPKNINLTNFENILENIKEKYNNYTKSNTLNNQNYNDILSSILIVENDRKAFISIKSTVNCYYYFDENNSGLSTVFNTRGIHLIHKLYAFNKNKAVPENIALNTGLKSFSVINVSQKELNIINNDGILKELKVNNQIVDFNSNLSDFFLLCQTTDTVTYNTSEDKTTKVISDNFVSINKKLNPKQHVREYSPQKRNNKSFFDQYWAYIILFVMIGLIGCGWFFFLREDEQIDLNTNQNIYDNSNDPESIISNTVGSNKIVFDLEILDNKDSVFKTNYKDLKNFRYRYFSKKWQFQKIDSNESIDDKKWKPLKNENLINTFRLNEQQERIDFANELANKSKHELKFDNEDSNSKSEDNNVVKTKEDKRKTEAKKRAEAEAKKRAEAEAKKKAEADDLGVGKSKV